MRALRLVTPLGAAAVLVMSAAAASAQGEARALAGRWDAVVVVNAVDIPFRFDVVADGPGVKGTFFNGEQEVTSLRGMVQDGAVTLNFAQYGTKLTVSLADEQLQGLYDRGKRGVYPFRASRAVDRAASAAGVPSIAGVWKIPVKSPKGETAWRFIVRQDGAEISAGILRVDGDTGVLTGRYRDGTFALSHFSGARPLLLEVTLKGDGSLELLQNRSTMLVALPQDDPRARELGEPTDAAAHTRMKDPAEPLRFSFPDLDGRIVSEKDFAGKVVLVSITGSWCPNCHDEAPFLSRLYRKYKSQGLEIVGLSFEDAEDLGNPVRLRAFIKEYGLDYTFLLPGAPDSLAEKMPQAENLNAFPTTFLLGRDGLVRAVHAGFPSEASGDFFLHAQHEIEAQVQRLLAERKDSE